MSADDSGFEGLPESDEEWSEFFSENAKKLYGFFYNRLSNHQDAEDCLQRTFVKFFKHIDKYDQSRPPLPYLFGIAHRVFIDFIKAKKQIVNLPFEEDGDPKLYKLRKEQLADFIKEKIDLSFRKQQLVDFVKEKASLDESQCELSVMLVFHGFTPKEIACILGITSKSARQRIWKLRKLLRDRLDRDDFSSPWY